MMGLIAVAVLFWGVGVIVAQVRKLTRPPRGAGSSGVGKTGGNAMSSIEVRRLQNPFLAGVPKEPSQLLGQDIEWQWPLSESYDPGWTLPSAHKRPIELLKMPLEPPGLVNLCGSDVHLPGLVDNLELGDLMRPIPPCASNPASPKKRRRRTIVAKLERCKSTDGRPTWRWK